MKGVLLMGRRSTFIPEQHIGKVFHKLTIIEYSSRKAHGHTFVCECSCGNTTVVYYSSIKSGNTKSCGCYRKEASSRRKRTVHGNTGNPIFSRYKSMIDRCNNPENVNYINYGRRGIKVCEEWLKDFSVFESWALENGFDKKLSIERIDNDGGYSPENCKWANRSEQANNRRSNRNLTFKGRTQNLRAWANELGIKENTIRARLDNLGWSVEKSLTKPTNKYRKGREQ